MIRVNAATNVNDIDQIPTFTILSYNCLASNSATSENFPRSDPNHLQFRHRMRVLEQEFRQYNADIVCLQEIYLNNYYNWLSSLMNTLGYAQGLYAKATESMNGVATFFKADKFSLIEKRCIDYYRQAQVVSPSLVSNNSGVLCILELTNDYHRRKICIANTHLSRDPELPHIQLFQLKTLFAEAENMSSFSAFVLAGDFNRPWSSVPVDYIRHGCIPRTSKFFSHLQNVFASIFDDNVERATNYLSERNILPDERLLSAYNTQTFEMLFTVHSVNHGSMTADYIWYERNCMQPVELLDALSDSINLQNLRNFTLPNAEHPSDHLPIMAKFQLLPPTDW